MPASVTVHLDGSPGSITITQTGADTGTIAIDTPQLSNSEKVKNVRADPAALTLACQLDGWFASGDIGVTVERGASPLARVTVSNALAFNGLHLFPLKPGDDDAVHAFLLQAGFPPVQGSV